jgi:hypothetical protein
MILSGGFGDIVGPSRVKTQEAYQTILLMDENLILQLLQYIFTPWI